MIGKTGMVDSFDVSLSSSFIRKKRKMAGGTIHDQQNELNEKRSGWDGEKIFTVTERRIWVRQRKDFQKKGEVMCWRIWLIVYHPWLPFCLGTSRRFKSGSAALLLQIKTELHGHVHKRLTPVCNSALGDGCRRSGGGCRGSGGGRGSYDSWNKQIINNIPNEHTLIWTKK